MNSKYNPEDVIDRLLQEQKQTKEILNEIDRIYRGCPEFEGMTLVGGIKAIIKKYQESQDKIRALEKELSIIKKKA